jgi:hypothetical protein
MVSWLMKLVQDAYFAARLHCRCEDGITEIFFRYSLGTAEGEKDAAMFDAL